MTISTRTPEGLPSKCLLCGAETNLEFSSPAGDAPCPNCGYLLWESTQLLGSMTKLLAETLGVTEKIDALKSLAESGFESIGVVELIMEVEEEFDISIPDEQAENINTFGDAIRFILDRRKKKND